MKKCFILLCFYFLVVNGLIAQEEPKKFVFTLGLAGPELLHLGILYRFTNANQFGFNTGFIWFIEPEATFSLEHRWYIGESHKKLTRKIWFLRQGITYYPKLTDELDGYSINFTIGKDIPFKNIQRGATIDAGIYYRDFRNDSNNQVIWPAIRLAFYFYSSRI